MRAEHIFDICKQWNCIRIRSRKKQIKIQKEKEMSFDCGEIESNNSDGMSALIMSNNSKTTKRSNCSRRIEWIAGVLERNEMEFVWSHTSTASKHSNEMIFRIFILKLSTENSFKVTATLTTVKWKRLDLKLFNRSRKPISIEWTTLLLWETIESKWLISVSEICAALFKQRIRSISVTIVHIHFIPRKSLINDLVVRDFRDVSAWHMRWAGIHLLNDWSNAIKKQMNRRKSWARKKHRTFGKRVSNENEFCRLRFQCVWSVSIRCDAKKFLEIFAFLTMRTKQRH